MDNALTDLKQGLPWTVVHNSWEVSTVYSHDGNAIVAECPIDGGVDESTQDHLECEKENRANLIAAAPELLRVLALFVRAEKMARDGNPPHGADALIELGDAAIARATGAA